MKKIILILLIFLISNCKVFAQAVNYDEIYNNLPVLDVVYDQSEDPDEQADSLPYFQSPYPLIRTAFPLSFKSIKFKPGYYLLTPRTKDGFNFIMFKQYGKIAGLVPVYEQRMMTPEEVQVIFPPPPKPKTSIWSLPWRAFKGGMKKAFGKYEKPPELPRCALDASIVEGNKYFEMVIYRENYVYKVLLKIER